MRPRRNDPLEKIVKKIVYTMSHTTNNVTIFIVLHNTQQLTANSLGRHTNFCHVIKKRASQKLRVHARLQARLENERRSAITFCVLSD
jgi:hypothetical protein